MGIALYAADGNPTRALSFAAESEVSIKRLVDMPGVGRWSQALRRQCVHWRAATI